MQKEVLKNLREFLNNYYNQFISENRPLKIIKESGDALVTKYLFHTYNYVNSMINNTKRPFKPFNVTKRKTADELLMMFP